MQSSRLLYEGRIGRPHEESAQNAAFPRAVHGTEIKEAPPADVPQLLNHMRRVGYNLDQILKRANSTGVLDVPQLRKDIADIRAAVKAVQDAYTMKNS